MVAYKGLQNNHYVYLRGLFLHILSRSLSLILLLLCLCVAITPNMSFLLSIDDIQINTLSFYIDFL